MLRLNRQYLLYLTFLNLLILFCVERLFFSSTGFFERITSYITYPIVSAQGKFSDLLNTARTEKQSAAALKAELDKLKSEHTELVNENVSLKASLGYLEQVSELIEFRKRYAINAVAIAQIISKQISTEAHIAYIDKGSNAGIENNMIAIYKNNLVGRIFEVYPTYSKLLFITDKTCKVAAYCYKTGSVGIFQGNNQLTMAQLKYVSHLNTIIHDDLVVSSGQGLIFPQGFALGRIDRFSKDEVQYNISVKPIIDFKDLKYCQIIKK